MGGSSSRIYEGKTNHAAGIPESASKKLYNSIVRIEVENSIAGTGFFIKHKIKNKERFFLVTCHHVIKEEYVLNKKEIKFYYGEYGKEQELKIELNRRNIKYFAKPLDATLIEILEKDNISKDKFLQADLNYKNGYDYYLDEKINDCYLAGYPNNKERTISSGKIKEILEQKEEFKHTLDTKGGNSGSPICLANNLLIIGIHKQGDENEPINYGTFLGYIIDILENELEETKSTKLWENIKAINIIKKIFSYLDEKIKFKAIKYNKKLQNQVDINFIKYKYFSGRYIEYGENGKGKEFSIYDDKLIYEGEYLNGKRNGKGKEYYLDGKPKFEGEYLNGKRNGKGKEYNLDGKPKFEGEYLNGKRNGKGKEYNLDGKPKFEGEYLNGKKNGKVKEYYDNGILRFEGEYLNGNKWNGKGYDQKSNIIYELNNGNGNVKEYNWNGKLEFEGEYLNGKKKGKGREYFDDGTLKFKGEYLNGKRNGNGKEYNWNGTLRYEGEYLNGKKNGKGKEYNLDGKLVFEGEYLNGKRKGEGKIYDLDGGLVFGGNYYLIKKMNERGKEYNSHLKLTKVANLKGDKFIKKIFIKKK